MNTATLASMQPLLVRAVALLTVAALTGCDSGTAPPSDADAAVFFKYHGYRRGTFAASPGALPDTILGPFAAAARAPSGELYLCAAIPNGHGTSTMLLLNLGIVSQPTLVTLPPPPAPGAVAYSAGGLAFAQTADHSSAEDYFTLLQGQASVSVTPDSVVGLFAALFATEGLFVGTTSYSTTTSGGRFAVPIVSRAALPYICGP